MFGHKPFSELKISRWSPHRMQALLLPFQRLVWVPSSLTPPFETGTYGQLSLCLMLLWNGFGGSPPPYKNPAIFKGSSVDYGSKSTCGTEWKLFEIIQDRNKGFGSINRNHQSFGYSALIRGVSARLFLRQRGVKGATFLPEIFASRPRYNHGNFNE